MPLFPQEYMVLVSDFALRIGSYTFLHHYNAGVYK